MEQIRQIKKRFTLNKCLMLLLLFIGVFEGRAQTYTFGQKAWNQIVTPKYSYDSNGNQIVTYEYTDDCDNYASRNSTAVWKQTHGLPTPNADNSSVDLKSSSVFIGQGIFMPYSFKKKHIYSISLNGRKSGNDSQLGMFLTNGLVDVANTGCSPYSNAPLPTSSQQLFANYTDFAGGYNRDLGGLSNFTPNNNYTQIWLYNYGNPFAGVGTLTLSTITITDLGDPNEPTNSISVSGIQKYEYIGTQITNLTINGTLPIKGGTNGNPPVNGYRYQWQISVNGGSFNNIAGATSQNYVLTTSQEKSKLRRIVYTDDYPEGVLSGEVSINILLCTRGAIGSNTLCDNQNIYLCTPGLTYTFRGLIGSVYVPFYSDKSWKYSWDYLQDNTGSWQNFYQKQFASGSNSEYSDLPSSVLSFVKNSNSVQEYVIVRKHEEYYAIWPNLLREWHEKSRTNTVKLTLYKFENPDLANLSIQGPTMIDCKVNKGTYQLFDNKVGAVANGNNLGIKSVTWTIPPTWEATSLISGTINPNYFKATANNNIPQGGTITATVRFLDGKIKVIPINVTVVPTAKLTSVVSPAGTITLCQYISKNVSVGASNGSGTYGYSWNLPGSVYLAGSQGRGFSIDAVDLVLQNKYNVTVSDAVTKCFIINDLPIATPGLPTSNSSWNTYKLFVSKGIIDNSFQESPQVKALPTSDIIVENSGLPYYVGTDNKIYYFKYAYEPLASTGYWLNEAIPSVTYANGGLTMYEPTVGNRTIYYTRGAGLDIYSVSATNGQMNWGAATPVLRDAGATGNLKIHSSGTVYYRKGNNNTISKVLANAPATVVSILPNSNFEIVNNKIYYVNPQGNIAVFNLLSSVNETVDITTAVFSSPNASVIVADNAGNVYFTNTQKIICRVTPSNKIEQTYSAMLCNGYFSVNKVSKCLYVAGTDNNIYQVMPKNRFPYSSQWNSKLMISGNISILESAQKGSMVFSNPNIFFVAKDGFVRVVQYNTNNTCIAANVRSATSIEEELDDRNDLSDNLSLTISPNPVSSEAIVHYSLATAGKVQLSLSNSFGKKVLTLIDGVDTIEGQHQVSLQTNGLAAGVYILSLQIDGEISKTIKVLVQ